jgi:hypothetical protein
MTNASRVPGTVNIYRVYRNVPTQSSDWLRTTDTLPDALAFRPLYESANHFAIAIYEVDHDGMEDLRYDTLRGTLDRPTK